MSSGPANLRACAAVVVAALAAVGCGSDDDLTAADDGAPRSYTVDVEQVRFPAGQRLADKTALSITVRNAGERAIPNLAITVRGFSARSSNPSLADPRRALWVIDAPPPGAATAIEDTWAVGALAPNRRTTLRWRVTPVVAGTHKLDYAIAASLTPGARTTLEGGGAAKGSVSVRVTDRPAQARVDPRTGAVIRQE